MSLMSKSQFAASCGVHRSRISHYISDGKLDGAAIVGVGRKAMIDSDVALRQLRLRLDSNQMCGLNGLNTNFSGKPRPAKRAAPAPAPVADLTPFILDVEDTAYRLSAAIAAKYTVSQKEAQAVLRSRYGEIERLTGDPNWLGWIKQDIADEVAGVF